MAIPREMVLSSHTRGLLSGSWTAATGAAAKTQGRSTAGCARDPRPSYAPNAVPTDPRPSQQTRGVLRIRVTSNSANTHADTESRPFTSNSAKPPMLVHIAMFEVEVAPEVFLQDVRKFFQTTDAFCDAQLGVGSPNGYKQHKTRQRASSRHETCKTTPQACLRPAALAWSTRHGPAV
jgi:hypothetical protein